MCDPCDAGAGSLPKIVKRGHFGAFQLKFWALLQALVILYQGTLGKVKSVGGRVNALRWKVWVPVCFTTQCRFHALLSISTKNRETIRGPILGLYCLQMKRSEPNLLPLD